MRIVVEYHGKVYKSKETCEVSVEEAANAVYENFSTLNKIKLDLEDGGYLVLGERALQSAVFMFLP